MHTDGDRGSFAFFFAMAFLGKDRDENVGLPTLRKDILEAIAAIEKPKRFRDEIGKMPAMRRLTI